MQDDQLPLSAASDLTPPVTDLRVETSPTALSTPEAAAEEHAVLEAPATPIDIPAQQAPAAEADVVPVAPAVEDVTPPVVATGSTDDTTSEYAPVVDDVTIHASSLTEAAMDISVPTPSTAELAVTTEDAINNVSEAPDPIPAVAPGAAELAVVANEAPDLSFAPTAPIADTIVTDTLSSAPVASGSPIATIDPTEAASEMVVPVVGDSALPIADATAGTPDLAGATDASHLAMHGATIDRRPRRPEGGLPPRPFSPPRLPATRHMAELKPGDTIVGRVRGIADFGVFVDIGLHERKDGLVRISHIAERHIAHPSEAVTLGQDVTVYVLSVDIENGRVSLSMRDPQQPRQMRRILPAQPQVVGEQPVPAAQPQQFIRRPAPRPVDESAQAHQSASPTPPVFHEAPRQERRERRHHEDQPEGGTVAPEVTLDMLMEQFGRRRNNAKPQPVEERRPRRSDRGPRNRHPDEDDDLGE